MTNNNLIIKNSLFLYVRLIIVTISGLVSTSLILRSLGINSFGLYSVVGGVVSLFSIFNTIMVSTSNRFIAIEIGKNRYKDVTKILNISLIIQLGIALLVFIFAFSFGEWYINKYLNLSGSSIEDAIFIFRLSILGSVISFLGVPFRGLLIAKENFFVTTLVEITISLLKLILAIILLYFFHNKLRIYAVFMSLFIILPTLIYLAYCKKKYKDIIIWKFQKKWSDYKEILSFSIWVAYGAIATIGKSQGANLMINFFYGTSLNASLGIANRINFLVVSFSTSVGGAVTPQIFKSFSSDDKKRMEDLVISLSKFSFFLLLIPSLPLLLNMDYILNLWLDVVPNYSSIFASLIIIETLISSLNAGIPAAIQATGNIKWYQIVVNTVFLLSLPIAFYLLKAGFEPYSVQYTYIAVSILVFFIRQYMLKNVVHFDIKRLFKESYLPIMLTTISLLPVIYLRQFYSESIGIFIYFSIGVLINIFISVYYFGLKFEEKVILRSLLSRIFK